MRYFPFILYELCYSSCQISNIALNGRNKLRERVLCWILIICLQFHRFGHNTTTQILFSCCVCLTDCSEWTEMRFKFLDAVLARVKRWCQPHCIERHATHTAHNTQHILNVISFLFWLEQIDRCIPKSVCFSHSNPTLLFHDFVFPLIFSRIFNESYLCMS